MQPDKHKICVRFRFNALRYCSPVQIWDALLEQSKRLLQEIPSDTPVDYTVAYEEQEIMYKLNSNQALSWNIRIKCWQFLYECHKNRKVA